MRIFWILIRPCYWKNQPFAIYHAIYPPEKALAQLPEVEQDLALTEIVTKLDEILSS